MCVNIFLDLFSCEKSDILAQKCVFRQKFDFIFNFAEAQILHLKENFVPKPLDERCPKENLSLAKSILLENLAKRQHNLVLVLIKLSLLTLTKVFCIMDARKQ